MLDTTEKRTPLTRLYRLQEVADACGVTVRSVQNWIERGLLTVTYITQRTRRIREEDFNAFIDGAARVVRLTGEGEL